MNPRIAPLFAFVAAFLSSCSGTYTHTLAFNPAEPIRVAVLPFIEVNSKDEIVNESPDLLIDSVSVVSSELGATPAQYTRALVQRELSESGLDVISPTLIDSKLSHNGFDDPKVGMNLHKLRNADLKELCSKLLACDAVLLGKVTRWDRSYYGIQSVTSVGVDLQLVAANDRRVLFGGKAEDSESRGLTKGPTGLSDLVLEPIKGLDNKITEELAAQIVKKLLVPLRIEKRPEFLESAPPMILASAHDQDGGHLSASQPLTVLMLGTPRQSASFSIDKEIEHIPMVEKDEGHYVGKYYPLPTDHFERRPIVVSLADSFGRVTTQKLGGEPLSLP